LGKRTNIEKINKITKSKTNQLYLSSIRMKEKKETVLKEYEKFKREKEMKDCTFKPHINKHNSPPKKEHKEPISKPVKKNEEKEPEKLKTNKEMFYQRENAWQNKKNEKFENFKNYLNKEEYKACTFQPVVKKKSAPHYEKVEADINSLKYYDRINKAKQEKIEKYEKLNPNINELYEKNHRKTKNSNEATQQKEEEYCTFNPNKKKV